MVRLVTIDDGFSDILGDLAVTAKRVDHPPVRDCYALRFEAGGRSIVFSADTCYFRRWPISPRAADVLVPALFSNEVSTGLCGARKNAHRLREHLLAAHTTAADAGKIAKQQGWAICA